MNRGLRPDLRKGWCPGALRPMLAKDGLLVRLRITGGLVSAKRAQALADLAEAHGSGLFDLSARANLQMRGVRPDTLPALARRVERSRLVGPRRKQRGGPQRARESRWPGWGAGRISVPSLRPWSAASSTMPTCTACRQNSASSSTTAARRRSRAYPPTYGSTGAPNGPRSQSPSAEPDATRPLPACATQAPWYPARRQLPVR